MDTRIIAATNENLEKAVELGRFRKDLFYRINVIRIHIPPLKGTKGRYSAFSGVFLEKLLEKFKKGKRVFSEEAIYAFMNYDWPGNIRELQNMIERAVALSKSEIINVDELPFPVPVEEFAALSRNPLDDERKKSFIVTTLAEQEKMPLLRR